MAAEDIDLTPPETLLDYDTQAWLIENFAVIQAILLAGGGGGAPTTAEYIVGALNGSLSAERLVTNTATVTWDLTTPGQVKANASGGLTQPQILARGLGA